jgi:hypothetical protein
LKQTRKGGKDTKDNRSNWERFWRKSGYPIYKPEMNYPGFYKKYVKKDDKSNFPFKYKKVKAQNTYIIQRHGFSCANLSKVKGDQFHGTIADPSLTAYGIYSLLREQKMPQGFDRTVFVSSLVRTWQTAILEYGQYGPLTIVVSPYIKEKHGWMADYSNIPLPLDQQMSKMEEFMQFLKGVDHEIARKVVVKNHIIVYDGIRYPLGPYALPKQLAPPKYDYESQGDYVEHLKDRKFLTPTVSTSQSLKIKAVVPVIPVIPEPSFREYYGAEGFVFFDDWVRQHYPDKKTIFVVSHSNWMQKIIKQYAGEVKTPIFDENAWKLTITPFNWLQEANFEFLITPGVPKPSRMGSFMMSVGEEPTCRAPPVRALPQPLSSEQYSSESDEVANHGTESDPFPASGLEDLASDPLPADGLEYLVKDPESSEFPRLVANPFPRLLSPDDPRRPRRPDPKLVSQEPRTESIQEPRPRAESLSSEADPVRPSFHTEAIPVVSNVNTVPVTNETTKVVTRSFTELVHMLCDRSLATGLNALMASKADFKTKVVNYIQSNPYVMVSDPTDASYFYKKKIPIYLFENHYLIFILLCKPYLYQFVNGLETSDDTFTKTILSYFNLSVPIPVIVSFLKQLQQIIEDDKDVYHLLLSICSMNANKHYAFKENDLLLSQTLLDLLVYELQVFPVTTDNIEFMYTCIIDLIRYGARCSKIHYSQGAPKSLFEKVTGIELPSSVIVPFKMPIVDLELLPKENEILQTWESEKRALDPNGILSQYQDRYTDAKRRLRAEERKVQVLYNTAKNQIDKLQEIHDDFLTRNSGLFAELDQIKKEYRAARASIDPDNHLLTGRKEMHHSFDKEVGAYLNPLLANHVHDSIVTRMHNDFFKKFTEPMFAEPSFSIGGSKGTSWKRSSLRQSSTKAARYRASLYKGKRRTRANRS